MIGGISVHRDGHIPGERLLAWIVFLVLIVDYLVDPLAATALAAGSVLFLVLRTGLRVPLAAVSVFWLPTCILLVGIFMGSRNTIYDLIKDVWYFVNPLVGILLGMVIAWRSRSLRPMFYGFLVAGTLLSIVYIARLSADSNVGTADVETLRQETGKGYFPSVLSLILLLIANRGRSLGLSSLSAISPRVVVFVNTVAVIASLSRTMWFMAVAALLIYFRSKVSRPRVWGPVVIVIALFSFTYAAMDPQGGLLGDVVDKISRSFMEILPADYSSLQNINRYWRGFESLAGIRSYLSGSLEQQVLGKGFGTLTDLGLVMDLGGTSFRYIPIFHNGYIYLLVKVGLLGLAVYALLLWKMFSVARSAIRSRDTAVAAAGELLQIMIVLIVMTTVVVSGLFNKSHGLPLALLTGCALMVARQHKSVAG